MTEIPTTLTPVAAGKWGHIARTRTAEFVRPASAEDWRRSADDYNLGTGRGAWTDANGAEVYVDGGPDLDVSAEDILWYAQERMQAGDRVCYALARMATDAPDNVPERLVYQAQREMTRRVLDDRSRIRTEPRDDIADAIETAVQSAAVLKAAGRQDWYARLVGGRSILTPARLEGPYTYTDASRVLRAHRGHGGTGQLLRVTEDYAD